MRKSFYNRRSGQGLVEYALLLGLIAITAIGALTYMGEEIGRTVEVASKGIHKSGQTIGKAANEAIGKL